MVDALRTTHLNGDAGLAHGGATQRYSQRNLRLIPAPSHKSPHIPPDLQPNLTVQTQVRPILTTSYLKVLVIVLVRVIPILYKIL